MDHKVSLMHNIQVVVFFWETDKIWRYFEFSIIDLEYQYIHQIKIWDDIKNVDIWDTVKLDGIILAGHN